MVEGLKRLVHTRKYVRAKITRLSNEVTANINTYDVSNLKRIMNDLKDDLNALKDHDNKVLDAIWDDELADAANEKVQTLELDSIQEYKTRASNAIMLLESRLGSSSNVLNNNVSRLKPETAPLPSYSGEPGESLEKFVYIFEATVAAHNYTDFEKFLLLQKCVQGRAATLIKSLESDKQTYIEAKTLLEAAFAAPLMQAYNTLQRLIDLKLPTSSDPLFIVSEMRQIKDSVRKLKIDMNVVLQFFYWRSLPDGIKSQLIQISNNSKPDLVQIESNIFSAIERDSMNNCKLEVKPKSNNFAATIDYKPKDKIDKNCSLCKENHAYYKCVNYKTPVEKLKKLRELNGCVQCGYINHTADKCRLINLKCKHCNGKHFPCLCTKPKPEVKRVSGKPNEQINNNIVWTSQAHSSSAGFALPTFTCFINNKTIRVMKDTGAQATLISDKIVTECNLKVVRNNVNLTINGFNGPKDFTTKVVEVPICIDNDVKILEAISVPNINIVLKLSNLGTLVNKLKQHGYRLADELLTEHTTEISDIDIVLGSDFSYCNPINTKLIGKDRTSTLLVTPNGVMLEGSIDKLIKDIDYEPNEEITCDEIVKSCYSICSNINKEYNYSSESKISYENLQNAAEHVLDSQCNKYLGSEISEIDDKVEENNLLVNFAYDNTTRDEEGRLQMPLLWNPNVKHLLGNNENLAKQILKTNFKKLSRDPEKLKLTDNVFKEHEQLGVIEKIENIDTFKHENPNYSFLPHMSVFRMNKETTKCRVVYLSNLVENNTNFVTTVSHNQAIMSGPNLNPKLFISLVMLRFDKYIMIYDLVKAFLMIAMKELDQSRLLLLWYRDVSAGDYSLVYYKAKRLPFGISCAPSLLMLALQKILILDDDGSNVKLTELRRLAYSLIYMDNGAYTCNDLSMLSWARENLVKLFNSYKFDVQQIITNVESFQCQVDEECGTKSPPAVGLFGLSWNRLEDSLSTAPLKLDAEANTKRLILKSYAENFDLFGINVPLLNRAKLFIHELQCSKLSWDEVLPQVKQKNWSLICKQVNNLEPKSLNRFVGKRDDEYRLVAFTDASKDLYGTVVYIQNLKTCNVNFLVAKNRVVGSTLQGKSIPSLELNALQLGVETIMDIKKELCDSSKLSSIINVSDLKVYTDSMVALSWLDGVSNKLSKSSNKLSVFVRNRLFKIQQLCKEFPVTFEFIAGEENPADQTTRAISSKLLANTNYYTGPLMLNSRNELPNVLTVVVPCPSFDRQVNTVICENSNGVSTEPLIPVTKYSSYDKYLNVYARVLEFVHKLKCKVNSLQESKPNFFRNATVRVLRNDQITYFPDCVDYFERKLAKPRSMPNIVKQLNIFMDSDGILRVRGKITNDDDKHSRYPVLLSKDSILSNLIIMTYHTAMGHAGKYAVLTVLRKIFWIPKYFSKVKNVLKNCNHCARFNNKPISLNQSPYRLDQLYPSEIPFRTCYIDHFGPYSVKFEGSKRKIYLLLVTCVFTRAFNAVICLDMSVSSFLRAFQMHIHRYGMPDHVTSDPGSSLVAGTNLMATFLNDSEVSAYLSKSGMKLIEFVQFCKGNSALGSLVEIGVKLYKRLVYGFIRNNCLNYHDFEFLVSEVNHLINKRPVAFMEASRDDLSADVPDPITPEMLIYGRTLPSVNCIPGLHPVPDDPDYVALSTNKSSSFSKLEKIRSRMLDLYKEEYYAKLMTQSLDQSNRYSPKKHHILSPGDIVLIKEKFTKVNDYPLAIVRAVTTNCLGEVTSAELKRGDTGEIIKRHSSNLIPLLQFNNSLLDSEGENLNPIKPATTTKRTKRSAAIKASNKIKTQINEDI